MRRFSADSLLEIIIAAVLIVVVFGIALMVFSNVLHASRPVRKVKAYAVLRRCADEMKRGGLAENLDTVIGDFRVYASSSSLDSIPAVRLHLSAVDEHSDTIAMLDQIILKYEK